MTPSLEGWPTKAKEAPSPHEVRLAPLGTNPVFQSNLSLGGKSFFIVTPSLEGWPTKAKEAPSPHEGASSFTSCGAKVKQNNLCFS